MNVYYSVAYFYYFEKKNIQNVFYTQKNFLKLKSTGRILKLDYYMLMKILKDSYDAIDDLPSNKINISSSILNYR